MIEKFIQWIHEKQCGHIYRKHYSRASGRYVNRCTRCNKIIER